MAFAREVSNRVAFFKDGLIHEIGSPKQIFEAAQRPETAAFLKSVL
jgi:polar amino acid transport system ATP-binding protein